MDKLPLSLRLRNQAATTGLDAVAEILIEAADALDGAVGLDGLRSSVKPSAAELGEFLFSFEGFTGWVNNAQYRWKAFSVRPDDTVCIDSKGRICRIGRHFMVARDEGAFPVNVYRIRADMKGGVQC
jgi:hypothetical protein